jgi:hypothetical protein
VPVYGKIFDPAVFDSEVYDPESPKLFDPNIFDFNASGRIIVTLSADMIDVDTARLRGRVTVAHVAHGFEWGTVSEGYTHSWTEEGIFPLGEFTHVIIGLDPHVQYFFKAKARLV